MNTSSQGPSDVPAGQHPPPEHALVINARNRIGVANDALCRALDALAQEEIWRVNWDYIKIQMAHVGQAVQDIEAIRQRAQTLQPAFDFLPAAADRDQDGVLKSLPNKPTSANGGEV